jgi:Flp pilus assembly pilin Flp
MLVLLALVAVVGATTLGNAISTRFKSVGDQIQADSPVVPTP